MGLMNGPRKFEIEDENPPSDQTLFTLLGMPRTRSSFGASVYSLQPVFHADFVGVHFSGEREMRVNV